MKKILVLVSVLALSPLVTATNLTWNTSEATITVGQSITFYLSADDDEYYDEKWVGSYDTGAVITNIIRHEENGIYPAGESAQITSASLSGLPGWWAVAAMDLTPPYDSVQAGIQWDVTIQGLAVGEYSFHSEYLGFGEDDILNLYSMSLTVVAVPEPASITLLVLGGSLFIRRK